MEIGCWGFLDMSVRTFTFCGAPFNVSVGLALDVIAKVAHQWGRLQNWNNLICEVFDPQIWPKKTFPCGYCSRTLFLCWFTLLVSYTESYKVSQILPLQGLSLSRRYTSSKMLHKDHDSTLTVFILAMNHHLMSEFHPTVERNLYTFQFTPTYSIWLQIKCAYFSIWHQDKVLQEGILKPLPGPLSESQGFTF